MVGDSEGSPQGASVSPLLANIYLHYVFDQWADWHRRRDAHGDMIIVRFADDFVVGSTTSVMQNGSCTTFASGSRSSAWNCTRARRA